MAVDTKTSAKADKGRAKTPKKRGALGRAFEDLRFGQAVSLDTFRRNAWVLVPVIVVVLALMGLRYKTKSKMEQIRTLTTELQRSQSTKLQEKAQYMSLIRETEMLRMVEEKKLGLVFREEPPVEVQRVK